MSRPTHRSRIQIRDPRTVPAHILGLLDDANTIRWHKQPGVLSGWFGEIAGLRLVEAALTGRPGIDNYPWDWHTTDALGMWGINGSGVADTLRSAKEQVRSALKTVAGGTDR